MHLHKCGGTSVEQAFAQHARWNDLIVGSTRWGEALQPVYKRLFGLTKHSPARQIADAVGAELWSACWTIALVRHPLRIQESFYGWMCDLIEQHMATHGLDRDQFVRLFHEGKISAKFAQWPITQAFADSSGFSEFIALMLERELLMRTLTSRLSRSGSQIVDDVYKLEEIDRFWDAFAERTGVRLEPRHANKSAQREYHWDRHHIEEMYRRYGKDFINFGYE